MRHDRAGDVRQDPIRPTQPSQAALTRNAQQERPAGTPSRNAQQELQTGCPVWSWRQGWLGRANSAAARAGPACAGSWRRPPGRPRAGLEGPAPRATSTSCRDPRCRSSRSGRGRHRLGGRCHRGTRLRRDRPRAPAARPARRESRSPRGSWWKRRRRAPARKVADALGRSEDRARDALLARKAIIRSSMVSFAQI